MPPKGRDGVGRIHTYDMVTREESGALSGDLERRVPEATSLTREGWLRDLRIRLLQAHLDRALSLR